MRLRVLRRFLANTRQASIDLRTLDITSENLESVLNDLISGIDDLDSVEEKLGLSLRSMTQLMKAAPHNDDIYHNGEDVLTHIGWVMDDVKKVSENMDANKKALLKLTALCHDLGKAYTYKYDPAKNKHTFYGHGDLSVEIAKALLEKHKATLGDLYQDVLDFTRLHDVFYALASEKSKGAAGNTKYVRRLMKEVIYQRGLIRDLFEFTKADSYRAKAHADKIKETSAILDDIEREAQFEVEVEAAKAKQVALIQERMPEIRAYLERESPEAANLLPDLQAVKRYLGTAKRYDIIKGIDSIVPKLKIARTVVRRFQASSQHAQSIALMKFLSKTTKLLGVAEHVYVVGGAVRNFILDQPIKDIDVVIDSIGAGKDSEWLANQLARAIPAQTNLTVNQYGVAILTIKTNWILDEHDLKGETIEIANARKESYGGAEGKGYKPHMVEPATIDEDLKRREFSVNALLWRLADLEQGPNRAEILDLLGVGKKHLEDRELHTPVDPDKTFSDDPTRILRAIKFTAKYGFKIPAEVAESIRRNAQKLKQMPWDAVRKLLVEDILEGPVPRKSIALLQTLGISDTLAEMLEEESGFAAALARSLSDKDTHLILDLLDLGWTMKTPFSFLDKKGLVRLREILLMHAQDPSFVSTFVQALLKPPLNQPLLFSELNIPPRERGTLAQTARRLLLINPELSQNGLEDAVRAAFGK